MQKIVKEMTITVGFDDGKYSVVFGGDDFFNPIPAEYDKRFNVTYTENYTLLNPAPYIEYPYPFGNFN